jgi:hypothetical protein
MVVVQPMASVLPAPANQLVGDILEYAEPFHAVGSVRRVVRQGGWGQDADGDGVNDSFRFEWSQVFVGLEAVTLPSGTLQNVAHFRNVTVITLQPSKPALAVASVTATEEAWWAPGIGLVRVERSAVDETGSVLQSPSGLLLVSGAVGGKTLFEPDADLAVVKVALVHRALVFDSTRSRYYASIPGNVLANGNRIATVDAATGAVSLSSAAVGSEPGPLALSADGSALFVGLLGSGDVVKLSLPDMRELWRARLPSPQFYGQLFAETLSVSPVDADVVAV